MATVTKVKAGKVGVHVAPGVKIAAGCEGYIEDPALVELFVKRGAVEVIGEVDPEVEAAEKAKAAAELRAKADAAALEEQAATAEAEAKAAAAAAESAAAGAAQADAAEASTEAQAAEATRQRARRSAPVSEPAPGGETAESQTDPAAG